MKTLIFVLSSILVISFVACDKIDEATGVGNCLRPDEPEPPLGTPDDVIWYQESQRGVWIVIYQYNCYEDQYYPAKYREFTYKSPDDCSDYYLLNSLEKECDE